MTRLFPLLAALVVGTVALSSCDSSRSNTPLDDLDGTYALTSLIFDPETQSLPDADISGRLDASGSQLEIFAGNSTAQMVIRRSGQRTLITFDATATRGQVTFTARPDNNNEASLRALLIPTPFSLTYNSSSPGTLLNDIPLAGVNLQAFDPSQYQGQVDNRGTLRLRFERI